MGTRLELKTGSGKSPVGVSATENGVSWKTERDGTIVTNEILFAQLLQPVVELEGDHSKLIAQYVKINFSDKLKTKMLARRTEVVFVGSFLDCNAVKSEIEDAIRIAEPGRPKRLLIFINPKSGFGTSVKDYYATVAPLLAKCGLTADAIVTESPTHAAEVLADYDLSSVDVVVSMGGDGSVAQVTNGLLRRTMKDANKDIDDPSIEPVKPSIPLAHMPSGSGCAVFYSVTGTLKDLETAVLTIALGRTIPYDVIAARQNGRYLGYGNIMAGCGVFTNVLTWLESVKWLGILRYWFMLPRAWWTWFNFDIEIDYLPVPEEERVYRLDPEYDSPPASDMQVTEGPWPGWKTLRCKGTEVWIFSINSGYILPGIFVGDYVQPKQPTGRIVMDIYRGTSFFDTMKAYRTFMNSKRNRVPRRYIEQIEASAVRVRGLQEWRDKAVGLFINVDADRIDLPDGAHFESRVHHGLLSVLSLNSDLVERSMEET